MKIRKPLELSQIKLVSLINKFICEENPHLQYEFDLTMINPVINSANDLIANLSAQGDFLFKCDCVDTHDEECELTGCLTYSMKDKYKKEWLKLASFIQLKGPIDEFSYIDMFDYMKLPTNTFKGLLSECIEQGFIVRGENEMFNYVVDEK